MSDGTWKQMLRANEYYRGMQNLGTSTGNFGGISWNSGITINEVVWAANAAAVAGPDPMTLPNLAWLDKRVNEMRVRL